MLDRSSTVVAIALVCALTTVVTTTGAQAADDGKYPTNWKGQWTRVVYRNVEVQGAFVQTKPWGRGQEAPLTAEYQKVHEDSMADQANGGLGNYPTARCLPSGMPRMMTFGFQEYVITPAPALGTPAPWVNVIANPEFGCLVSDSGLGYTWAGNSQLNRLTPWSNDPVTDPPAEVVYLRDQESGDVWTPTPQPRGEDAPTLVRHGQGYTSFERHSHGIAQRSVRAPNKGCTTDDSRDAARTMPDAAA